MSSLCKILLQHKPVSAFEFALLVCLVTLLLRPMSAQIKTQKPITAAYLAESDPAPNSSLTPDFIDMCNYVFPGKKIVYLSVIDKLIKCK